MSKIDEIISKSLNEVEEIIKSTNLSKGIKPEEVSDDTAGAEGPEEGTEEGAGEEPDADDTEGTDTDTDDGVEEGDEDVEKSLEADLNKSESASSALEVSEFLAELVKSISTVIENQRKDISKSMNSTTHQGELLAQSFSGLAKSQKAVLETQTELYKSISILSSKIDAIASQPTARKSMNSVHTIEKSFKASVGNAKSGSKAESLTKSQAVEILANEFANGKSVLAPDILALESTGDFNVLSSGAKTILGL